MGVPKVGKSINIEGVTAYQDSEDASTWWYIPNQVPVTLGQSLLTFQVKYWGISAPHFSDGPFPQEITGAIVSGQSVVDLNTDQRNALIVELKENYGIAQPKIKPVDIKNVAGVQLTLATNTLKVSDKILPSRIQLGTSFSWTVGANNSLFAEFVAGANYKYADAITPNPNFGFNINAEVEMQGDPWIVIVKANLDQTWRYIRNKFDAKVSWGTAFLGTSIDALIQDLQVSGAVTIQFIEGSLDNQKYGNQLFEIGNKIFEQLNTQLLAKDGLFKLEPNPTPPEIREPDSPSWLPTFNLAYNAQIFSKSQNINYEARLEYTGRVIKQLPLNVILAVNPSKQVENYFVDMDDDKEPFITIAKVNSFRDRMAEKANQCKERAKEYEEALLQGRITLTTYSALMNELQGRTSISQFGISAEGDNGKKIAKFVASRNIIATNSALAYLDKLDKAALSTFYHQIDSIADLKSSDKLVLAHPVDDRKVLITKFFKGASRNDWILKGIELAARRSIINEDERDLLEIALQKGGKVQVIIPGSVIVRISSEASTHFPYSVYGMLEMTFPNGETYVGTAWQYSSTVLVTCAHNLYYEKVGGRAISIKYLPRHVNGNNTEVSASRWFYPSEYERSSLAKRGLLGRTQLGIPLTPEDVLYDYGVVILGTGVPASKVFNMPSPETTTVGKLKAVGYGSETMEESEGNLVASGPTYIYHGCSTEDGWSGSAVTGLDNESVRYAIGIHCGGGDRVNTNIARRIDNNVIADIERWSRNSLLSQESIGNF